ncbi:MAG: hypothetical protein GF368_02405 [Candidatus Aenigmarchaeota archaeon]|nr:hypothetical protein [Candidatus Aenigmarchaeota archaeon]
MVNLVLLITAFLLGLVFQSLLHGASRMLIDAFLGFLGGLISGVTGNYIPLSFVLGCFGRMVIGGYIVCIVLMAVYIGFGFFVGYYIF